MRVNHGERGHLLAVDYPGLQAFQFGLTALKPGVAALQLLLVEPAADGPLAFGSSFSELLRTDWSNIAQSVELDALGVSTASYWESVKAQRNIGEDLVEVLMAYYSG